MDKAQISTRQAELKVEQARLRRQIALLEGKKNTNPKSGIPRRFRSKHKKCCSPEALRAKRQLQHFVTLHRARYNYRNPIEIGGLKYVPIHSGQSLALVSSYRPGTNRLLPSVDKLPLWIEHGGKKYVKDYTASYQLQPKDRINKPLEQQDKQACLWFTRTGRCDAHHKHSCKFLHDLDHVALCPNILTAQRQCTKPGCTLSHNPNQYNAPSCRFYQDGACSNPNCIYSHKREPNPQDTPVCREFAINGYCDKGRSCPLRHAFQCPDLFDYGYCIRGRACHLDHTHAPPKATPNSSKGPVRNADNDDVTDDNFQFIDDNELDDSETDAEAESELEQVDDTKLADNLDYVSIE